MNVYFISGLGADKRAFEKLKLPAQYTIHHLDWIEAHKNESLESYARRLAEGIDTSAPYSIVGLSMGGMIAASMTAFLQPRKTVLISSIGCNKEFPRLLRFARITGAYRLIPDFVFKPRYLGPIQHLMGTKSGSQKALIRDFVLHTNPAFMQWAIGAIINWQHASRPPTLYHIHGSKDKMFPLACTTPNAVVKGGTHFMVWMKAGEVSALLAAALAQ